MACPFPQARADDKAKITANTIAKGGEENGETEEAGGKKAEDHQEARQAQEAPLVLFGFKELLAVAVSSERDTHALIATHSRFFVAFGKRCLLQSRRA